MNHGYWVVVCVGPIVGLMCGFCVCLATWLESLVGTEAPEFDCVHSTLAPGRYVKPRDFAPGVRKHSLRSLGESGLLAWGSRSQKAAGNRLVLGLLGPSPDTAGGLQKS